MILPKGRSYFKPSAAAGPQAADREMQRNIASGARRILSSSLPVEGPKASTSQGPSQSQ